MLEVAASALASEPAWSDNTCWRCLNDLDQVSVGVPAFGSHLGDAHPRSLPRKYVPDEEDLAFMSRDEVSSVCRT